VSSIFLSICDFLASRAINSEKGDLVKETGFDKKMDDKNMEQEH